MKNIFENAYLGKMYKTRDGRKAVLYSHTINNYGFVIIHDTITDINHACIYEVNCSGEVYHECNQGTDDLDIVSEWQEEISEEELDELAELFTPFELITCYDLSISKEQVDILRECFKAGYRKALKQ